jgi:hypothetical protein
MRRVLSSYLFMWIHSSEAYRNKGICETGDYAIRPLVNEFYKKGCQEKSSASTGGVRLFLEIQPTVFRYL